MNFVVRQRIVVGNERFPKLGTDTDLTRHAVPPRTLTCVYWKELTHIPESPSD